MKREQVAGDRDLGFDGAREAIEKEQIADQVPDVGVREHRREHLEWVELIGMEGQREAIGPRVREHVHDDAHHADEDGEDRESGRSLPAERNDEQHVSENIDDRHAAGTRMYPLL